MYEFGTNFEFLTAFREVMASPHFLLVVLHHYAGLDGQSLSSVGERTRASILQATKYSNGSASNVSSYMAFKIGFTGTKIYAA